MLHATISELGAFAILGGLVVATGGLVAYALKTGHPVVAGILAGFFGAMCCVTAFPAAAELGVDQEWLKDILSGAQEQGETTPLESGLWRPF